MLNNINCSEVLDEALWKWPGILMEFGIDPGDGRHQSCPVCGGKDRFRFDNKEGRGTWICNQCGAGDGIELFMRVTGYGFVDACKDIGKVIGMVEKSIKPEKKASPERLRDIFKNSRPIKKGDPVSMYLDGRGLSLYPSMLRYGKCWEYETKQSHDAMLAVFSQAGGEAVTIHRTFIQNGKKLGIKSPKKFMPSLKKMTGGAIRLYESGEVLGVAEGIETAIACHEMFKIPVWAVGSAVLLEGFEPPPDIKKIEVFSDNDKNFTGQKAAYTLANRLAIKGMLVSVRVAMKGDFLEDMAG